MLDIIRLTSLAEQNKYVTNSIFAHLEVNIGVPFHVIHVVRDRNHGSILLVDLFVHIGCVNELEHYCVVMSGIVGGWLPLHELNLHYEDLV